MKPFLGIYREPAYSPGRHNSNDAKILRLVGMALERENIPLKLTTIDEARNCWKDASLIFSMCQGPDAIAELTEWQSSGALICNDPAASRATYRDFLCRLMLENHLAFPKSVEVKTDGSEDLKLLEPFFENDGAWLKRDDVHATQAGDVLRIEKAPLLPAALKQFSSRGLKKAVLQAHCAGDEVKFYAVRGDGLFWPYYPKECEGYPFVEQELQRIAEQAAAALDIAIYGGDAIISSDGKITLIDLNDWPSFAPCRGAAASAIARYLKETYYAYENNCLFKIPSPLAGEG
jgi:hypothetical protein